MKRTAVITVSIILLLGTASGVVGGPEPQDGEATITSSGGSASASTSVNENGTDWRAEISMVNRSQTEIEGSITGIEFSETERRTGSKFQRKDISSHAVPRYRSRGRGKWRELVYPECEDPKG